MNFFPSTLVIPLASMVLLPGTLAADAPEAGGEAAASKSAIESAVRAAAPDGNIAIRDPRSGRILDLTLVKFHETPHVTQDGSAYLCVDFKDDSGKVYDVDAFVSERGGNYQLQELLLHKAEGKDRIREPQGGRPPSPEVAQQVRGVIESWAGREADLRGGQFPFHDPRTDALLGGKVESVHTGVHVTGDGLLYACVDVSSGEQLYDLDVYVRPSGDGYEVAEVLLHKVDGKDRLR